MSNLSSLEIMGNKYLNHAPSNVKPLPLVEEPLIHVHRLYMYIIVINIFFQYVTVSLDGTLRLWNAYKPK